MCTPGACIICYDSHPPPIDSGCGCRSGNELAHPNCRVKLASFQHAHRGWNVWETCQTCQRSFGGKMRNLLAIGRVFYVTNPMHPNIIHWFFEKLPAIRNALYLSENLITAEKYTDAEQITRALLGPIKRLLGYRDLLYLQCESNMAISQSYTGKYSESNWRFVKVIKTLASVYCLDDWMTLSVRFQYMASLLRQLVAVESYNITRYVLRITRKVFGEHHENTMAFITNLAKHISRVDLSKSYTGTTLLILMRVFSGIYDLATSLSLQAQFDEAESLYTALLGAQEGVLGKLDSQTVKTRRNVIACKVARYTSFYTQFARHTPVTRLTPLAQNALDRRTLPSIHHGMHRNKLHQSRRAEMMMRRILVTKRTSVTTRAPNTTVVGASRGNVDHRKYTYTFTYTYQNLQHP
jgi:hypothetical protein